MIVADEWLAQNSQRAYPFRENAPRALRTTGGGTADQRIPDGLFVDTVLTVPGTTLSAVYLSRLAYVGDSLSFAYAVDGDELGSIGVDLTNHQPYQGYGFAGTGEWADVRGTIVLGDLRDLEQGLAPGSYRFEPDDAPLELAAVRPSLRGVQSIRVRDASGLSDLIQQHVQLREGSNIRLTYLKDTNEIRIDALSSAGFEDTCPCDETEQEQTKISRINGIAVEDLVIEGDNACIKVEVSGNTLTIKNTCAEPCCGCDELKAILLRLQTTEQSVQQLEGHLAKVESAMSSFQSTVLYTT